MCPDSVNGRLWSYGSSHIGEWVAGGHLSYNQVSYQLRTPLSVQGADEGGIQFFLLQKIIDLYL